MSLSESEKRESVTLSMAKPLGEELTERDRVAAGMVLGWIAGVLVEAREAGMEIPEELWAQFQEKAGILGVSA